VLAKLQHPGGASHETERKGSRQSISSRVVLRVETSSAYRTFKEGGVEKVSEYDFCDLLYCTLESTPETFEKNFLVVRQEVEAYGRKDLSGFLDKLKGKFAAKFTGKRARGGLMPKKRED
jgi:hypothetical protein